MRYLFGLIVTAAALCAWAGTRSVVTNGAAPQSATDGVGLGDVTACRAVVYFTDGGTIMGGKLMPHYRDSTTGQWTEGPSTGACALDTTALIDGGSRHSQECEWKVSNSAGRAAVAGVSLVGEDAGAVTPQLLLSCYGERLP